MPIPIGFGEQDIMKETPRLFSDKFMLFYITEMSKDSLTIYSNALSTSSRQDVVDYFKMCV
ncbi:DUF3231 family protein [Aquibacillus halophilus]|uniref:DUF3231 family protein n=1 Tax=Aquibacillus halophilus TaxID=930132 RepID=UPI0030B80C5D